MSIVERAVDLFDMPATPYDERSSKKSVETEHPATLERAAAILEADDPGAQELHVLEGVRGVDAPPPAPRRSVSISREMLRRQRLIVPEDNRTALAENFRRIKRHILVNLNSEHAGVGANLIMVTSALPGEGKTFCSVNLAISLSMEVDCAVLLVDADVAKPSVTSMLGMQTESERGLMDVLNDPAIPLNDVICDTDIPKLTVLPAGTRHLRATEILASNAMRDLLDNLVEQYPDHVVIFDSPPLLAASEASALASGMGQIALVVEAGKTTETALKDALSRIQSAKVIGALLNKGPEPGAGVGGYGYGYGYGYGHGA
jgi:protein-tyrosine kinase